MLSKVEARQSVTGHNVRYVLWFGLAAVIVVFAAIYFFYFEGARYFSGSLAKLVVIRGASSFVSSLI